MPLSHIFSTWNGEALEPWPRFKNLCDKELVIGEKYRIDIIEERSQRSHAHYFAQIHDIWLNLPENIASNYPSSEHLRKRALIEANFYDEEIIDCGSNKVAPNVAAAIRRRDDFALIFVRDQFVIIRTAKSQSKKAMGGDQFQGSKTKVLEIISEMIGVNPEEVPNEMLADRRNG